jgi:hypothetical protein
LTTWKVPSRIKKRGIFLLDLARNFLGDAMGYNLEGKVAESDMAILLVRGPLDGVESVVKKHGPKVRFIGGR